jgi:16S rRNA G966 N2-methylase RsmD
MYLLHKWWARKPHNIVYTYISTYSEPGDVVLDPFLGSGPTVLEAVRAGRRAIGFDIDPLATYISRMTALPTDIAVFRDHFHTIEKAVRSKIEALYMTQCPKHKTKVPIVYVIWADESRCNSCGAVTIRGSVTDKKSVENCHKCHKPLDAAIKVGSTMLELGYECEKCLDQAGSGRRFIAKPPDDQDKAELALIEQQEIPAWIPDTRLYYPDGRPFIKKEQSETVADLFSKRALISLSLLFEAVRDLPAGPERDMILFCFSSNLHSVSKLNMVHGPRWRKGTLPSRAWVIHSFYVPPLRIEFPVWYYFVERFESFVRGKTQSNAQIPAEIARTAASVLSGKGNLHAGMKSALELHKTLPEESVDYVFTDPPYGGAIQYLELSTLYTAWLAGDGNFEMNPGSEITINASQRKDFEYYHDMLRKAFENVFRALKPGRYMTVTFHSTDIKVWNSILQAINLAGFVMEKIIYQPPPVRSIKGMLQPYGSAVGDYYIRFHKPPAPTPVKIDRDEALYERVIVSAAMKIIAHRGEPTPLTIILNGILPELRQANALLAGDTPIEDVLKAHIGREFKLVDVVDDLGNILGKSWWFANASTIPYIDHVPLSERVELAIYELLHREIVVQYDDILQEIFIKFPNSLTPDTVSIQAVLKDYADKVAGGRWRLKPNVKARESEHSSMILYLAVIGRRLGFDIHVGKREQRDSARGISLRSLNSPSRLRLKGLSAVALGRIVQIDLIWYQDGIIHSLFEVENTTSITEALIRASNIPYKCRRFVVLPEERERLMLRKLRDPAFSDRYEADNWRTIYYLRLEQFYDALPRRRKTITEQEFEKIIDLRATVDAQGTPTLF